MRDDLLSFLVLSSRNLPEATERAVAARLARTTDESVALVALTVPRRLVRMTALRVLEQHGSQKVLRLLRDIACDGDQDREVRAAAERAKDAIERRAAVPVTFEGRPSARADN